MHVPVRVSLLAGLLMAALVGTAEAQKTTQIHPGKGGSPHVRTEWTVAGANISIEYGRPYLKNRTVGKDVEPMAGKIWRLGADEPTTLKTDAALQFGDVTVPAGTYSIWAITDDAGGMKLVVSKEVPSWGTMYPGEAADLARIDMNVQQASTPTEQLTLSIEPAPGGGTLRVDWGTMVATLPFTVQSTS